MLQRLLNRLYGKEKKAETSTASEDAREEAAPVNTEALASSEESEAEKKADAEAPHEGAGGPVDTEATRAKIIEALKTVYDPEIPVDIYALGLIYEIKVQETGMTRVQMTLTAPNCPAAGILPGQVESKTRSIQGVLDVELDLTFDPPWSPDLMSDAAKLELGML